MSFEIIESKGKPIKAWTRGVPVEEEARQQLRNLASMPFIHKHVAVMPDVHWGMGVTIGSVIATRGAIIPAAVGVDIGCGMNAVMTDLIASDLPDNLSDLRSRIERLIPHGRTNEGGIGDSGAWGKKFPAVDVGIYKRLTNITTKHPKLQKPEKRAINHMGTLGGGNHFIEICLDEEQRIWIMLHSGSRGIGNAIGRYFIEKAKEDMRRYFINLPDVNLAYLTQGTTMFNDYCEAVKWAQDYALMNRETMLKAAHHALAYTFNRPVSLLHEAINCHHNYVNWERHFGENVMITRKGAVNAAEGIMGIIPGSMGAKSFIVRGKGNRESFHSCSHGAGRAMSRRAAREKYTIEDHAKATQGVECKKDQSVLDETPSAYKPIDDVMKAQDDLVEVVHTLKQVVCVKG